MGSASSVINKTVSERLIFSVVVHCNGRDCPAMVVRKHGSWSILLPCGDIPFSSIPLQWLTTIFSYLIPNTFFLENNLYSKLFILAIQLNGDVINY